MLGIKVRNITYHTQGCCLLTLVECGDSGADTVRIKGRNLLPGSACRCAATFAFSSLECGLDTVRLTGDLRFFEDFFCRNDRQRY